MYGNLTLPTPKHARYVTWLTRNDTNDGALVAGIIGGDEYGLGKLPELTGTAIDIGAHIGAVACALAADHRDLRVIAVEPVPQNVVLLKRNAEAYGITVIEAACGAPGQKRIQMRWNYRSAEGPDRKYVDDSRFIGNIFGPDSQSDVRPVRAVSLDELMEGIPRLALLKIDCEGCEWAVLRSDRVADIDIIIGEFHNGGGLDGLRDLLSSHDVEQTSGNADIGVFRAVRR